MELVVLNTISKIYSVAIFVLAWEEIKKVEHEREFRNASHDIPPIGS